MPCEAPHRGSLAREGGTPKAFGFEGHWGLSAGILQDWGNNNSVIGGYTQGFMCTGSQGKRVTS